VTIGDPRDRIKCACPRIDGRDCVRFRCGDDMREHFGDLPLCDDDEECPCACHEIYEEELVDEIERTA
jgi:hypothetical protein